MGETSSNSSSDCSLASNSSSDCSFSFAQWVRSFRILEEVSRNILPFDLDYEPYSTASPRTPVSINVTGDHSTSQTKATKRRHALSANAEGPAPKRLSNGTAATDVKECPICLEPLGKQEISATVCGHIFCTTCIKQAIKSTKRCPNCRSSLSLKKIHPLFL